MMRKILLACMLSVAFANFGLAVEPKKPSLKPEESAIQEGSDEINFKEWESEFNHSLRKANIRKDQCDKKSKNCQFEKYQALDPSFDIVH